MERKEKSMGLKNFNADVSPEEMKCIQVVAILLIKLLIEYFAKTPVKANALKATLKVLEK